MTEHSEDALWDGDSGWVVIAVGVPGDAVYLEIDPKFGALEYLIHECGITDPYDSGMDIDLEPGVYWTRARVNEDRKEDFELEADVEWRSCSWPFDKLDLERD